VRLVDGKWVCAYCGTELACPHDRKPIEIMRAASGQQNRRALLIDGREIHSCVISMRPAFGEASG
jgi:hypothetical protein